MGGACPRRDARVVLHDRSARQPGGSRRRQRRTSPDAARLHRAMAHTGARVRVGARRVQRPRPPTRDRDRRPGVPATGHDRGGHVGDARSRGHCGSDRWMGQPGKPRDACGHRARAADGSRTCAGRRHEHRVCGCGRGAMVLSGVRRRQLVPRPQPARPEPPRSRAANRRGRAVPRPLRSERRREPLREPGGLAGSRTCA